ncbi:putative aminoadipate reductase [Mycena leptocephala]|nr:putative aminoadipate reductase [Mycena leptocephala]
MPSTSSSSPGVMIPDIVTLNSETDPSGPFYVYARPESSEIVTITHLEFARATHRAANLLRPNGEAPDGRVVAILALSDTVLYHATLVGLMTANLVPFPMSPRNSAAGIFQLLRASSCHRIVATCVTLAPVLAGLQQHIADVEPNFALDIEEIPSLAQTYPNLGAETPDCSFQPYSTQGSASLDDIALYMHSSGSSGLPKAIPQTHRALMEWASFPAVTETRHYIEKPIGNMALPSFHLFGIACQLLQPLFGIHIAVYPPTATSPSAVPIFPSPDNILDHSRKTKCRSLTAVPAFLAAWLQSPLAIAYLKSLHTVVWSGGSLPQRTGDALVEAGIHLMAVYGATEFGPISTVIPWKGDAKEWAWFRVSDLVKVRWVPQGDGTFEGQILTWEKHTPMVENLNDVRGYATSDLFINHPEKKHLWKVVGRVDDVIVHTSGEKTVPGPIEDIVASSPYVAGVVMFGSGRPQAGILIETPRTLQIDVQNIGQLAELRNKIWPMIEQANDIAPAFSRIFKEMILFTSPDKPLPRAGKGTVLRKAAIALYASEIDSIYNTVEEEIGAISLIEPPVAWEAAAIREWLLELAMNLCNSTTISPAVDLFQQGFDSLTATIFRLHLMRALRSRKATHAADSIAQNLIYSHPTIAQLSGYLEGLVSGTVTPTADDSGLQMENLIAKYTSTFESTSPNTNTSPDAKVVLFTGSTGNLGSHILASLLKDERVRKIYAFNRSAATPGRTLAERHSDIFSQRGLDARLLTSSKLVLLEGQLAEKEDLGLEAPLYDEIRNSVTLIIHTAWTLNFNTFLAAFEPHILGTRRLVDFALSSPRRPRFLFTSSVAAAQLWDPRHGPCPEDTLNDPSVAMGGYGQSKYVAEQIIAKSKLGSATCLRIGQVCGALPKGAWATSDWVPILVKTSITLGQLPLAETLVSWIDFETVAQVLMDVAFTSERVANVLNVVHPRPVHWNFVMSCMRDVLLKAKNGSKDLKLVPFSEWYEELEACEARGEYVKENLPGLKLLEFLRHLADFSDDAEFGGINFSVEKIQALSPAINDVKSIAEEDVEAWVDYWHASGFI